MSIFEEIDKAISAHGSWKHKLRQIIEVGESEYTVEHVSSDRNCGFGKWLHERIPDERKQSDFYHSAVAHHADFHKEAAKVLALGLAGKKEEASQAMSLNSPFAQISAKLTKELKAWQQSLK